MLKTEKQEILRALQVGRDALGEALAGVDEEQARRRPPGGGWSILGCAEHVAISERYLLSRLTSATRTDQALENRVREERIPVRGLDRSWPVASPEGGWPTGRFASVDEALADFDATRAETVRFVETFEDDPRRWLTDHPVIPGPVNLVEILLTMAVHPARHAKQIAEIREGMRIDGRGTAP